ncbi:imidazole glycerol phosphate synthase subunit HisF [Blochmannia endosymbiont of Polyrhachis (Hedomyrma) turneri]|uniref:imidazole glycerol phosphate synthase subunit HisF n=1 Tax=Blochmannia endosymbiont of Polyrhachis (Hedomyrma) turneri TaxID=1505596 RepID=UPI00061A6877|nr:imidazole glycerol phosphate synthase subunit HisF [Blochmannia endosymbiont of Polyrhachis (Hedomyrma) turneri]AKC60030.1 imidazole glycerol phosphate synthase subunit hisF [Blochmannia endosymbiont of Polyrhachis (Hedomyrma) turneri]
MLAKRIIPCLDVHNGQVVKGRQFRNHNIVGNIIDLAQRYVQEGADELIFYDITASPNNRTVNKYWINQVAEIINIPFCVAGGINTLTQAKTILSCGADKISINSPALLKPILIKQLSESLGSQCIVVAIDSWYNEKKNIYQVKYHTGDTTCTKTTNWQTIQWIQQVQNYGAGEIVLNMMNQDGMQQGYDIKQLQDIKEICQIPLIASGGAGTLYHFLDAFQQTKIDGALAASVFHKNIININILKQFLQKNGINVRLS